MGKIEYVREKCIGCGVCEMLAPHIWKMNEVDGKADLLDSDTIEGKLRDIWNDEIESLKEIERSCPSNTIKLKF